MSAQQIAREALAAYDSHAEILDDEGYELIGSVERAEWLIARLRPLVGHGHD